MDNMCSVTIKHNVKNVPQIYNNVFQRSLTAVTLRISEDRALHYVALLIY